MGNPLNNSKRKFGSIKRKHKGGIVLYNAAKNLAKSLNNNNETKSVDETIVSIFVSENYDVLHADIGNVDQSSKTDIVYEKESYKNSGSAEVLDESTKADGKKEENNIENVPFDYGFLRQSFEAKNFSGRRICSPISFIMQILSIERHSRNGSCSFVDCRLIKEVKHGFHSKLIFECSKCLRKDLSLNLCDKVDMTNLDNDELDLNYSAVLGAIAIGCGFSQLEEFFGTLNISPMGPALYSRLHDEVGKDFIDAAGESMRNAVEEEVTIAKQNGDIDPDGIPNLAVKVDGVYSHRSYGSNYKALSGAAAIVGKYTNKVLWYGVKNKYCKICANHKSETTPVKDHACNISHIGSSSSMEASILVDGFSKSEQLYGVRYGTVIADGDSSVIALLIEAKPYEKHIVKVECKNHLHRNNRKSLTKISNNTKFPIAHRKLLKKNLLRFARAINCSVNYWRKSDLSKDAKIRELKQDIQNSPYHIFGQHENCRSHFCDKKTKTESNYVPEMKISGIFQEILNEVNAMSFHSTSLIENVDQNIVEQFNYIVAKFVGGKRINYSIKNLTPFELVDELYNTIQSQFSLSFTSESTREVRIHTQERSN